MTIREWTKPTKGVTDSGLPTQVPEQHEFESTESQRRHTILCASLYLE